MKRISLFKISRCRGQLWSLDHFLHYGNHGKLDESSIYLGGFGIELIRDTLCVRGREKVESKSIQLPIALG